MVPLTMYLLRYGVIQPALEYGYSFALHTPIQLQLPDLYFAVLVLANMFLGAAGYVINDYFDRKIDSINHPDTVIVGKTVHRRFAIILHFVFNSIGVVLGAILSWYYRKPTILLVYLMIAGIFWLYSIHYKKQFLVGNIIVALGTAMIPLQLVYFDLILLNRAYGSLLLLNGISFMPLFYWIAAFALFAFLVNLIREIIKDIEDYEGDRSYGCNSLPIVIGINKSKGVVVALSLITIALLGFFYFNFLKDPVSKIYLSVAVALPLLFVSVLTIRAKTLKHYHLLSILIKVIMLTGVLYALVAKYLIVYLFQV